MVRIVAAVLASCSLALCLASPIALFIGRVSEGQYRLVFLFSSIAWFAFAGLWASKGKRAAERGD